DRFLKLRHVLHRLAVHGDDHVAGLDARSARGRVAGREILHDDAGDARQSGVGRVLRRRVTHGDAERGALHVARLDDLVHHRTRVTSLLPGTAGVSPVASILTTATSVFGSRPTTFASNSRRSSSRTVTLSAPSMT